MLWVLAARVVAVGRDSRSSWLAVRASREIHPTRSALDRFGRELRPALVRVRDEQPPHPPPVDGRALSVQAPHGGSAAEVERRQR